MTFKDQYGNEHEVNPSDVAIQWRISVYGVVTREDNKLLMLQPHFNPQWQFPGGKVEINETVDETLKREFLEEVGYKIDTHEKEFVFINEQNFFDDYNKQYYHSLQLLYKVKLADLKQYPEFIETGEGMDYGKVGWIEIDTLTEKNVQHTHWPVIRLLETS